MVMTTSETKEKFILMFYNRGNLGERLAERGEADKELRKDGKKGDGDVINKRNIQVNFG